MNLKIFRGSSALQRARVICARDFYAQILSRAERDTLETSPERIKNDYRQRPRERLSGTTKFLRKTIAAERTLSFETYGK